MQNSKIPYNSHLFIENSTYGLFLVDSTDRDVILKTTDEGTVVSTVFDKAGGEYIDAFWHDRANNDLYYAWYTSTAQGTGYIDLNDSDAQYDLISDTEDNCNKVDTFIISGTDYLFYNYENIGTHHVYVAFNDGGTIWTQDMGDHTVEGDYTMSYVVVVGTDVYYIWHWGTENAEIWEWDSVGHGFTEMEDCGANTELPNSPDLHSIVYDNSNVLYFILYDSNDSKYYLYSYAISTDTLTDTGYEYGISFMLNRNTLGTANTPWEYPKGYGYTLTLSSGALFQFHKNYEYLLKLQDLGLAGAGLEIVMAISDKYLLTTNADLYLYTNSITEFAKAESTNKTHALPVGRFEHTDQLSSDQLIEVYEFDDPDYVKCFSGKLGRPTYRVRKGKVTYRFKPKNLGFDDLKQKISYTATAEGIDEVVIALFGELTNPYLYCDATSVPNIATNMTYTFTDVYLKDALYVCAILGNAYWWCEPNGYSYFRAWPGPDSTNTFTQATSNMGPPRSLITQIQYNDFSNVRGGWDSTAPFTPTTPTIAEHVQQYGRLLWDGRKIFSGAISQASLDAIVAGLKAWQGMVSNPVDMEMFVLGYYYSTNKIGYYASTQYTGRTEFATATDRINVKSVIDFKRPGKIKSTFSDNLVRKH